MVVGFVEDGRHETEARVFVREDTNDAGAAFEFLVDAFDQVGCPEVATEGSADGKRGKSFRDIEFGPSDEFGFFFLPGGDETV